jgi:quercetin dioxygenase-like cupin family protein
MATLVDCGAVRNSSTPTFQGQTQGDTALSLVLDTLLPGASPGPRRHPYPVLLMPEQGIAFVTAGGQSYQVYAGHVLLVPPRSC